MLLTLHLLVLNKRIIPQIIRPVPNGVDRLIGRDVQELRPIRLNVLAIRDESRNLILPYTRKRRVDYSEPARRDVVAADRTGDGVIVEIGACVLLDVFAPNAAAVCGCVVLSSKSAEIVCLVVRWHTTGSTHPTGGALPLFSMKYPSLESSE